MSQALPMTHPIKGVSYQTRGARREEEGELEGEKERATSRSEALDENYDLQFYSN